jgi:O-antigen/teichoic acid export membrane protein
VASGFASTATAILAATVNSIAISRSFGPAGKGEFAIALSLGATLAVVLSLGLEAGVMKFAAGDVTIARQQARTATLVCLCVTPLAWLLGLGALLTWSGLNLGRATCAVFAAAVASTLSAGPAVALLRVEGRQHAAQWLASAYVIAPMTASAAYGVTSRSVTGSIAAASAGYLLVSATSYAYLARATKTAEHVAKWQVLVRYSLVAHAGAVLYVINSRAPILILGWFGTTADAGLFSVANSIAELSLLVSQSLLSWTLVRAASSPNDFGVLRRSVRIDLAGTTALLILSVALAPLVIPIIFGPQFTESWRTLAILAPGILAISVWRLVSYDLAVRGLARARFVSAAVGFVAICLGILAHVDTAPAAGALTTSTYLVMAIAVGVAIPATRKGGRRVVGTK